MAVPPAEQRGASPPPFPAGCCPSVGWTGVPQGTAISMLGGTHTSFSCADLMTDLHWGVALVKFDVEYAIARVV